MKYAVCYRSLTGCTKKVAQAIYDDIKGKDKALLDIKDNPDITAADIVALGYYVDQAGPDDLACKFITRLKGKRVFVFCTLAYFADSTHAFEAIQKGIKLVQEAGGQVIGSFIANGALAPQIIAEFKRMAQSGNGNHHAYTPEKGLRYELFKNHPTKAECALASERFQERVLLSDQVEELKAQH